MTRAEKIIAFIEEYCRVPEGKLVGQKIKLAPFQTKFIKDVYDNEVDTALAILSMARKNAKTATIACLLLAHTVGPEARENSQIVSGAMSREQAALVFNLAVKIIRLDSRLESITRIVPSHKQIFGLALNVEYRAMSAEASTAMGVSPVLIILDEIGQIKGPTSPFVEALTTSQGAHENPLIIAISTQASSDADMLSLWIDDAIRSDDKNTVVNLYAAQNGCDLLDRKQWKKANPALGLFRDKEDLKKQLTKASRLTALEAGARNLLLNQRVSLINLWLAPSPWKACNGAPDLEVLENGRVALGLDLSARTDLTAAVIAAKDDDGVVHVVPFVFTPLIGLAERALRDRVPYDAWVRSGELVAVPGASVDYNYVSAYLKQTLDDMGIDVDIIAFDRWRINQFKAAAEDEGFAIGAEWLEIGQGFKDFSPRITAFEHIMLSKKLRHGGHPLLNMSAANAISVQDPAGNRKLDKAKSTQRIDPIIALVMAAFEVTENSTAGIMEDSVFFL